MNILIIGEEVFASMLGNKLRLSHHYNKHFIACQHNSANESEIVVDIDFKDENKVINFCIENKIDVVVLASKQVLENGFYERLKTSAFMDRTIIVGVAQATIQQFNHIATENKLNSIEEENIEQLVVLTDGKIFKVLNEKNELELQLIEQQILEKVKEKNLIISGFICFNVSKKNENYTLFSTQFVISNEVASSIFERLETDVLSLFAAMDNGTLEDVNIEFYDN